VVIEEACRFLRDAHGAVGTGSVRAIHNHIAINHLQRWTGESSITVPNFALNCGQTGFSRHYRRFWFARKMTLAEPHVVHVTPFGARLQGRCIGQFPSLEKSLTASCRLTVRKRVPYVNSTAGGLVSQ